MAETIPTVDPMDLLDQAQVEQRRLESEVARLRAENDELRENLEATERAGAAVIGAYDDQRKELADLRACLERAEAAIVLADNLETVCRDALALSDKHRDAILYGGPLMVALDEYAAARASQKPGGTDADS